MKVKESSIKKLLLVLAVFAVLFSGCEKENVKYYERPAWLKGPLFGQIKSTGLYNEFVKAAELTGYDEFLDSRQTFTVFVPTDEAFKSYYSELGVNSIDDISEEEILKILQYHTLQNSWDSVKLVGKTSWSYWGDYPQNFRTRCIYTPPIQPGVKNVVYKNTFLLLFSSAFMNYLNLTPLDYETFYNGSTFTGFNIGRASVLLKEQGSENGFFYVIDKVMQPTTTADLVIAKHPEFSIFKEFLDKFIRYDYDATSSSENSQCDELYRKNYALNFNLTNETFTDNNPDGYYHVYSTVFVPTNQAIEDYFANKFSAYGSIDNVPNIIIKYFLESHMLPNKKLFPSILAKDENETNDFSDEITFELGNGINFKELSSNAMIYGVDSVINSNAFSTVSGPIISNPKYKLFTMLLELSGEINSFFKKEIRHVVFALPDEMMTELGFSYSEEDPIDFTDDKIFRDNTQLTVTEIKQFLQSYISITYKEINGVDESFIKTKNDNFLKIAGLKVNGVFGEANLIKSYNASNGIVFEVDRDLTVETSYTQADYLNSNKNVYSGFFALCDSAGLVDETGKVSKLSIFSGVTLLLPDNAAVAEIIANYIPVGATSETFDYRKLIQYQIISEKVIFTDDEFSADMYGTDVFENGIRLKINVGAGGGLITIKDKLNNLIQITSGNNTNIITTDGIIHVVDKVALY